LTSTTIVHLEASHHTNQYQPTMLALMRPTSPFLSRDTLPVLDLFDRIAAQKRLRDLDYPSSLGFTNGIGSGLGLKRQDDKYIATCALPGVKRQDIRLELLGNRTLSIHVHSSNQEPAAETDGSNQAHGMPDQDTKSVPERPGSSMLMHRSVTLPQLVDAAGITCTYQDGLLRIEVPAQAPALDEEEHGRMEALRQEAQDAAAHVAELEKQLREGRTKAAEAESALRSAQMDISRATMARRHTLTLDGAGQHCSH
jgi:HSP20 family molecular chaperone IbpA